MIVNNLEAICKWLKFNNKNEFYFLQIIQRKKDGNNAVGSNGYRTIKPYYIFSVEQLRLKWPKIVELCESNRARAYINPDRRNAQEVALAAIERYAELIRQGNAYQGYRVWDSSCGSTRASGYKPLWIIDVDDKDTVNKYVEIINKCDPQEDKIELILPTKSGYHIITRGFNIIQFYDYCDEVELKIPEIKKNAPTLLYFNDLSGNE